MFARHTKGRTRCGALLLSTLIAIAPLLSYTSAAYGQPRRATAFIYQPSTTTLTDSELQDFSVQVGNASKNAVAQANLELAELRLKDALLIVACDSPTRECLSRLASSISAERIFFVQIEHDNQLLKLTFNRFEAESGELKKRLLYIRGGEDAPSHFYRLVSQWFSEGLPNARLKILSSVPDLSLKVEGNSFGQIPQSLDTLAPDDYNMTISRGATSLWEGEVIVNSIGVSVMQISEGSSGGLEVELPERVVAPTRRGKFGVDGPSRFHWGAWTLLGVGGAALVTGGILGALVLKKEKEANRLYNKYLETTGSGDAIQAKQKKVISEGRKLEKAEFIMFGLGGAAVIAAATWLTYDAIAYNQSLEAEEAPETVAGLAGGELEESLRPIPNGGIGVRMMATPTSIQSQLIW